MSLATFQKHKKRTITLVAFAALLLVALIACTVYVGTYYRADTDKMATFSFGEGVTVTTLENGNMTFAPTEIRAGLIFYPGGKVEHTAYVPLMQAWPREGCSASLLKCPCAWRFWI